MNRRAVLAALCGLALGGCAIGSSDFACPGYPGKPLCLPTSEIYRLTNGSGLAPAQMSSAEQADADEEELPCCT